MPKEIKLSSKTELEIEKITTKELSEREPGVPSYKERCEYDEETVKRLRDEIFNGFDKLKEQRQQDQREKKWDDLDAQYAGMLSDDSGLEFNLSVPVTQVKCDAVERLSIKAFLESDPKYTVTPRPVMAKVDRWSEITSRQADYLDYLLDEVIDIESPLRKVVHQSVLLDVGILKIPYEYKRKRKRREEFYSAKREQGQQGETIPGLVQFLQQYPEAVDETNEGNWVVRDLVAGKDVTFKAEFNDPVYDDPYPQFVNCRDFFVDRNCEGYVGLCEEKLVIERQAYTWWQLKKAEANDDLINIDKFKRNIDEKGSSATDEKEADDYRTRDYTLIECTYHFDEKGNEKIEDEKRIICWFDVRTKEFAGAIYYPYDIVESYYIPFYVKDKKAGFYKGGLGEDLTHSSLAQSAMLNFMLTEAWLQLVTTPIIRKGSEIADQFLSKRWKPGIPLEVPTSTMGLTDELQFLEKPNNLVAQQIMQVLMFLNKYDDDRTGVSSLATGKESPTDPSAPAAKTAMLLQQSGINISDYIKCLLPSFNRIGEVILGLTYQMSKQGRKYRSRQERVVGGDIFTDITRDDMIAKTNIQSRAAGFDFDKLNEKRENMALFQLMVPFMMNSQIYSQNIEGIYTLARTLIQSWSPMWKNKVDEILPSPKEMQVNVMKLGLQSLQTYMQQLQAKAQVTGVEQQPELGEYFNVVSSLMSQATVPQQEAK